jgi:hypothetical protein
VRTGPRRRRVAALIAAVAVVLAASGLVLALLPRPAATANRGPARPTAGQLARAAAAIRGRAMAWVAQQVSLSTPVSCDPAMCAALAAREHRTGKLMVLRSGTRSPLGSAVVVATAVVRRQFGSRLAAVYAPAVIASFGSGNQRVDIRAVAPRGAAAYKSALNADLQARRTSGPQLLLSKRIVVAAPATRQLLAGQVDSRLLITMAGLAALHPIRVVDFAGAAPGAGPASPLRFADFAENTGRSAKPDPAYVRSMLAFLNAQRGVYAVLRVQPGQVDGGQVVLRIEFAAPSPLGLLGPQSL